MAKPSNQKPNPSGIPSDSTDAVDSVSLTPSPESLASIPSAPAATTAETKSEGLTIESLTEAREAMEANPPKDLFFPAPQTDPEHGDLTPNFVRWYLDYQSAAEFIAKYGARLDKLPEDVVARLNEGRIS